MESLGASQEELDLRGVDSLDEVARRVKARIDATPGDSWITGRNWDQSLWPGGAFPTAAVLDAVAPRPAGLAQSGRRPRRLGQLRGDAAGQGRRRTRRPLPTARSSATPPASPTGVFIDGAMSLVGRAVPGPTQDDVKRRLLAAQKLVPAERADRRPRRRDLALGDRGLPRARPRGPARHPRLRHGVRPAEGDAVAFVSRRPPRIARRPVRAAGRSSSSSTARWARAAACCSSPTSDDPGNSRPAPDRSEVLEDDTTAALRHGWQVCTHAIGDKGNALVLDAYAAARKAVPEARDPRLRIEHAQVVRKEDVAPVRRAGGDRLDAAVARQRRHALGRRPARPRAGRRRLRLALVPRRGRRAGARQRLSRRGRQPVLGHLRGITRQDAQGAPPGGWHPEQRLSLEETLRGFTAGAAFAAFAEDRLGILEPGLRADLTIVDRDLFRAGPLTCSRPASSSRSSTARSSSSAASNVQIPDAGAGFPTRTQAGRVGVAPGSGFICRY